MTQIQPGYAKACPIRLDHHGLDHARHWPETYRGLREQNPRAWSETYDGFWVATRLSDIVGVAQRSDAFSADKRIDPLTGEASGGVTIPPSAAIGGIPN